MCEILFRGQTRRYGEKVWMDGRKVPSNWAYGGICQGKGAFSIIYGSMDDKLEAPTEKHVVYTDTVGQYTGLTDKNGKKIFEGDVVRVDDTEIAVVEYDETSAFYMAVFDRAESDYGSLIGQYPNVEIIGNVHDNPELLKGATNDA